MDFSQKYQSYFPKNGSSIYQKLAHFFSISGENTVHEFHHFKFFIFINMTEQHSANNLGKNKLTLSSVRPLSVLIPPSWSSSDVQQPPSQNAVSPSNSLPTLSFDQLSLYAKKISTSGFNPFSVSSSSSSSTTSSVKNNKSNEYKKKTLELKIGQGRLDLTYLFPY